MWINVISLTFLGLCMLLQGSVVLLNKYHRISWTYRAKSIEGIFFFCLSLSHSKLCLQSFPCSSISGLASPLLLCLTYMTHLHRNFISDLLVQPRGAHFVVTHSTFEPPDFTFDYFVSFSCWSVLFPYVLVISSRFISLFFSLCSSGLSVSSTSIPLFYGRWTSHGY